MKHKLNSTIIQTALTKFILTHDLENA